MLLGPYEKKSQKNWSSFWSRCKHLNEPNWPNVEPTQSEYESIELSRGFEFT